MQVASRARPLSSVLKSSMLLIHSNQFLSPDFRITEAPDTSLQWRNFGSFCSQTSFLPRGKVQGKYLDFADYHAIHYIISKASFSTEVNSVESSPTEVVKETYDKMLQSVVGQKTMPPNAWLWSLIENCKNHDDIKLLFDILQNLRRFRLSNLRINSNFNCNLCQEVTKACARVGAIDLGKKALWKHNVYGLTPSIGSAHHLLLFAKEKNDAKLMVDVMKLLKRNDLPLQPGTADIVFRICHNTDNRELISKYSKRFLKSGIKLRHTTYGVWMEFAAKIGDTESLWRIEKLRSESMKQHTLATGLSCAKGLLLEHKPDEAAAIIEVLNQTLSDKKKADFMVEMNKLVNEWPLEVIKRQKKEDRKALASSLSSDIPAMLSSLPYIGLNASLNMDDLVDKEGMSS